MPEPPWDESFATLFRRFLEEVVEQAPEPTSPFLPLLRDHLGSDPVQLPLLAETFGSWEQVNVQLALDAWLERPGRQLHAVGVLGGQKRFMPLSLSDLIAAGEHGSLRTGPVDHVNLAVGPGRTRPCLDFGVLLLHAPEGPAVLLVRGGSEHHGPLPRVSVEAMAPTHERAVAVLEELKDLMRERNAYRGQVVSLGGSTFGMGEGPVVTLHPRPEIAREAIVLGEGVLERVERHVLEVGRHRERLRRGGRHLKRGLLLHGPPGTGKTLTVTYLIGRLRETTVLLLSGHGLALIGPSTELARSLQPALVVLEDVDLVAEERTLMGGGNPLLFELLNEMDGLAGDADVAFLLTTNRADLLEPALAARPGRIDQAVEIAAPDADGRRRLLALYGTGLDLRLRDVGSIVARTDGVSPAFVKELLRKAALGALEEEAAGGDGRPDDEPIVVEDRHVHAALDELLAAGAVLTRVLLGGASDDERRPPPGPSSYPFGPDLDP